MENKESKGWGTLLYVINQEQNDRVSFLKELIESILSPSNHLIDIGPELDGNTLYIKDGECWLMEPSRKFCLFYSPCELTYVFYKVRSAIIHGERWLVERSRKFCLFYLPCKWWLRNLAQRLFHNVSSYSFARRAPAFPSVKILFLTGEEFAWWGSRPFFVYSVFFIIGRNIKVGRGSLLLCSTELLLQVINLSLHGFIIISLVGYVTFPSKTASTCVDGMHTIFLIVLLISFTFKVKEIIWLMNICGLCLMRTCLMWTWSCHIVHYTLLIHKFSPQTAPIVGSWFAAQAQKDWDLGLVSPKQ